MKEIINLFENNLLETQIFNEIFNEIFKCNELTSEYGLMLHDEDVKEIVKTRNRALEKSGRIEFNGQIINKIIISFRDSPYISQYNYSDTINELVEIFYNYKNETLDYISDDELIEIMKEHFDNYCQGSLELLEGRVLYKISDNIRRGVKDYTNIDNEKD
ncbi:DUF6323 family protein [Clostridium vincentii]|uniref:Uncharacterized protein n=1 Tax=Clostridium vincentii TaxID=52704 RepID=A0A2T0BDQ9_9CLOT|nr:DUF6323 family protein [Clostridium vincentii]PRR82031.1 hypothetical protein CLVI_20960 [Clostridium vincentii]